MGEDRKIIYKVVETSCVTDEYIEDILNDWVNKGWSLDEIKFAMRESSKRPSMAFVIFTREEKYDHED